MKELLGSFTRQAGQFEWIDGNWIDNWWTACEEMEREWAYG
jgi:hypothetical protein